MRIQTLALVVLLTSSFAENALAQHSGSHQGHGQPGPSYAALMTRTVKGLSEEQISDLRAAKGMGLALAAELNGYPGPLHVLQLAEQLGLTPSQRAEIQRQVDDMKRDARALGNELITLETELDRQFASRSITPASLDHVTGQIGQRQAALRSAHLKYHLSTVATLSGAQVRQYNVLRGYEERQEPRP